MWRIKRDDLEFVRLTGSWSGGASMIVIWGALVVLAIGLSGIMNNIDAYVGMGINTHGDGFNCGILCMVRW